MLPLAPAGLEGGDELICRNRTAGIFQLLRMTAIQLVEELVGCLVGFPGKSQAVYTSRGPK